MVRAHLSPSVKNLLNQFSGFLSFFKLNILIQVDLSLLPCNQECDEQIYVCIGLFSGILKRMRGKLSKKSIDRASQVSSTFRKTLRQKIRKNVNARDTYTRRGKKYKYDEDLAHFLTNQYCHHPFLVQPGREHRGFEGFINQRPFDTGKMKGRLQAYSCKLDWGRHAEGVGELPDEPSDDVSDGCNDDNDDDDDGDNRLDFPDCNRLPNGDALSDENENVVQQPVNFWTVTQRNLML